MLYSQPHPFLLLVPMLLILTKVSIQVSDKYNFIEALSASIY